MAMKTNATGLARQSLWSKDDLVLIILKHWHDFARLAIPSRIMDALRAFFDLNHMWKLIKSILQNQYRFYRGFGASGQAEEHKSEVVLFIRNMRSDIHNCGQLNNHVIEAHESNGLEHLSTPQDTRLRHWFKVTAMALLGLAQVTAGFVAMPTSLGLELIKEGVEDLNEAAKGTATGSFSLVAWALNKAMNLLMALVGFGLKNLKFEILNSSFARDLLKKAANQGIYAKFSLLREIFTTFLSTGQLKTEHLANTKREASMKRDVTSFLNSLENIIKSKVKDTVYKYVSENKDFIQQKTLEKDWQKSNQFKYIKIARDACLSTLNGAKIRSKCLKFKSIRDAHVSNSELSSENKLFLKDLIGTIALEIIEKICRGIKRKEADDRKTLERNVVVVQMEGPISICTIEEGDIGIDEAVGEQEFSNSEFANDKEKEEFGPPTVENMVEKINNSIVRAILDEFSAPQ